MVGISGSQTGGQGVLDISLPELVQSGGSFGNWPLNLPPAGSQTTATLNVPYRFMGVTEELSWLAQFAGQGFEDISALANLIMLQEMMLGEEYQMICGSSANLATPGTPTVTARTAGSNETTVGAHGTFAVEVTATNWFGETAASASASISGGTSAGQVVDVTIAPVAGAMNYNIYVTVGSVYYLMATGVGGVKFTLQGTVAGRGYHRAVDRLGDRQVDPHRGHHPDPVRSVGERGRVPDVPCHVAGRVHQPGRRHPPVLQRDLHGAGEPVAADDQHPGRLQGRPGGDRSPPASTSRTCPTT